MQTVEYRINKKWLLGVALASGLTGSALTMVHLRAAPVEITSQENLSSKPIWKAARYNPNTLAAYTLRSNPSDEESDPIVIIVGQVVAKLVLPGESDIRMMNGLAYMYVTEEDLNEFPSALEVAKRDKITCDIIDTENTAKGLIELRNAYSRAHGISLAELLPEGG